MKMKSVLRNAPFVVFLCVVFLLWPGKLIIKQVEALVGRGLDKPLVGQFVRPVQPEHTLEGLWSHKYQEWAEARVSDLFPLRGWTIRGINQVYYDLFAKSYMGGDNPIIIGKRHDLFTLSYIREYCNTNRAAHNAADYQAWADRVNNVRRWFESQGKTFLYFISPSKAAYFPQDIPSGFGCGDNVKRPRYTRAVAAVSEKGIPFVDASALMARERGREDMDLFEIGGIHYNLLGAAKTVNALTAELGKLRGISIPPISTAHTRAKTPNGIDRDLTDLLNLAVPYLDYPTPELKWGGYPLAKPLPLSIAFVGGSFVTQPARLMSLYKLFDHIDHFSYFKLAKISYPGEVASQISGTAAYDPIFAADIVILEENEETTLSTHGLAFLAEAERRQALARTK
jgi:hypothetical protein